MLFSPSILIISRYMLTGISMKTLASEFAVPEMSIGRIIPRVCSAIWDVMQQEAFPELSAEKFVEIAQGFSNRGKLPHTIGCIDGKHIEIKAPANSGTVYYNYKHTFSIVLLAVCDADNAFTFVDIGAAGCESDGGIFRRSVLGKKLYNGTLAIPAPQKLPGNSIFILKHKS